ncbi:MAG: AAA domain-containing protein [Desulforhopalus sp.]|nr:AAA domain-containing protein [Desulforhopalus sp.]
MNTSLQSKLAGSFDLSSIDFISILDHLDEGVIITDHQGIIHYYNETQCQIDDLDFNFVVGKKVTEVYELCGNTSLIMLCLKLGRPIRNKTFFYKTKLGRVANTICSILPIFKDSQLYGAVCFVKDYKILRDTTPVISIPEIKPKKENGTRYTFADIIGSNNDLIRSVKTSRTAADSASPVMLIGETGTGKELFAQSIHNYSARNHNPYFAVNCAAIPETLLEGFLFGTTKGAFTGAMDKPGLLEQANGSTLFLDELLAMPVSLQVKLLRVIQEKKVSRIGSTNEIKLNIKIVSSINKPPRRAIRDNELRTDLFYRLGVVLVTLPPLRERLDDLLSLINHFLLILNKSLGTNVSSVSENVMSLFRSYSWPGNIRELEHLIEGGLNIIGYSDTLSLKHLSPALEAMDRSDLRQQVLNTSSNLYQQNNPNDTQVEEGMPGPQKSLPENQSKQERQALYEVLVSTNGNISRSSTILGISRQLLHYKMKKHGLQRETFLAR